MRNTVNILGVHVDKITAAEAVDRAEALLHADGLSAIYTPNPEIVMAGYNNPAFLEILNRADLCTADGIGVVYASRMLKDPVPERVAGFDLSSKLIEAVSDGSRSLYFFGGKPGVAELAIRNLTEKYPALSVCGFSDGYFDEAKEQQIIEDIKAKKPDILFVCLGAPKQEKWIAEHKDELGAKLLLGVGGSLDVWAGTVERAPEKYQKAGLEWFYRLLKQPSRFFRMMALPKFGLTVLFKGKRVKKGNRS